jgi:hypothetical protein
MPRKQPRKYANVEIQFGYDVPEEASVILRGDEMVIDMPDPDYGNTKYLIVGKRVQHYFAGINSAGPQTPKVRARWTSLGRVYVGQWIEEGQEYLFSFELSE